MCDPVRVDYTTRRPNKRRHLERCPECGEVGKVLRVPLTRGPNAGRVRVQYTHTETRTNMGFCIRIEDVQAHFTWEETRDV